MLRWALDRDSQRSHVVRASSLSSPPVMDTGTPPRVPPLSLPQANPTIQDLADGASASAVSLLDYRQSRRLVYARAGPALVACGLPDNAINQDALHQAVDKAVATRSAHSFILMGSTVPAVMCHLLACLTNRNKHCMAALRLINLFAGRPHHVNLRLPRGDAQWTIAPGCLPHDEAFAVMHHVLPTNVRKRVGIDGEPTNATAYQQIADDLATVGLDDRDENRLWRGVQAARLLLRGDYHGAAHTIGLPPSAIGCGVDIAAMAHFVYKRTVEWLVLQINSCMVGSFESRSTTVQIFCAPPTVTHSLPTTALDDLWSNWVNERLRVEFMRWWVEFEEGEHTREGIEWERPDVDTLALSHLQQTVLTRLSSADTSTMATTTLGTTFSVKHGVGEVTYDTAAVFAADRDESSGIYQGWLEVSAHMSSIVTRGEDSSKSPHTPRRRPRASSAVTSSEMMRSSAPSPRRLSSYHAGVLRHRVSELDQAAASLTRSPQTWVFCVRQPMEVETNGLLCALEMRDTARLSKLVFCDRYRALAPVGAHVTPELICSVVGIDNEHYTVGKHRVFLRHSAVAHLDVQLFRARDTAALRVQTWWRSVCARNAYFERRGCIIFAQAMVRRRLAIVAYRKLRVQAMQSFNAQSAGVSQAQVDQLKARCEELQHMSAVLAERGDALLEVVKRAFSLEYMWEESVWQGAHRSGDFHPYCMLTDVMERALTREAVYSVRTNNISYGAVVAIRILRYAGGTRTAHTALTASLGRLRTQYPALAGCEAVAYALRLCESDVKQHELVAAFNRAMDTACARFFEMMVESFKSLLVQPSDRGAYRVCTQLLQVMTTTAKPEWLRACVVEQVCARIDRVALGHVVGSNESKIGAQWGMEGLMSLESLCREALGSLSASEMFPWMQQALKACQLGNKNMLLQPDVRAVICPTIPDERLAQLFALYQVDTSVAEMLPHDLHRQLQPGGGSTGKLPPIQSRMDVDDLHDLLDEAGITTDRLLLECTQRLPDTVVRAMSKP